MRLTRLMVGLLLLGSVVFAQQEKPELRVNLDNLRYPPLAASAAIQGDVAIEVSGTGQKLVNGHPLLAQAARSNLEAWTLPPLEDGKYEIKYSFKIIASMKQETVLSGDKLGRFFLRLVGAPTKKVVSSCYYDPALLGSPPRFIVLKEGSDYLIKVFVTEPGHCLMTELLRSHRLTPPKSRA
jgi:hypothetical protein